MMKHLQIIANEILEHTTYRVYTPKEINTYLESEGEDDFYPEDDETLILCMDINAEEGQPGHLHPGFIIKPIPYDCLEASSIIPPGPVYQSVDIDGLVESMMSYYNELDNI